MPMQASRSVFGGGATDTRKKKAPRDFRQQAVAGKATQPGRPSGTGAPNRLGGGSQSTSGVAKTTPVTGIAPVSGGDNLFNAAATTPQTAQTGGQGGSLIGPGNTDPYTGFASRYAPIGASALWANPELIGYDVLSSMGARNPMTSGLGYYGGQYAQLAPYLQMLLTGGSLDATDEQYINTAADLLRQGFTQGGRAPDTAYLVNQLLGASPDSGIYSYLTEGTPNQQMSLVAEMLGAATYGLNPMMQTAIQNALKNAGLQYNAGIAGGQIDTVDVPYFDYLRQNNVLPFLR